MIVSHVSLGGIHELVVRNARKACSALAVGDSLALFGAYDHLSSDAGTCSRLTGLKRRRATLCDISHIRRALRESLRERPDTPFLRQLGPRDADAFVRLLRRRAVKRGQPILHEGAAGDDVIVVLEGRVKLVALGAEDREVVLAMRGPGDLIGEMAALGGQRRTATAIAVDDVDIGSLRSHELRAFLAEHPTSRWW